MLNQLLLLSKNDIPFNEGNLIIHQPSIKEIAYIGEKTFYSGCHLLNFSKNMVLSTQDKINSQDISDFNILMTIVQDKNVEVQKLKIQMNMVLGLLFPDYNISIEVDKILFTVTDDLGRQQIGEINENNFSIFKEILVSMFCLEGLGGQQEYNPQGELAQQIADKLNKRHQKLAEKGESDKDISIFSRYISILAVGEKKDMNSLLEYSVYQLFDEYKRFALKYDYDLSLKARLAGAKDVKEVRNWMSDVHSNDDNDIK